MGVESPHTYQISVFLTSKGLCLVSQINLINVIVVLPVSVREQK